MYNKIVIAFTFLLSYFAPIATIIHVMLIFILIDCISAIWAAKKNKEPIESRKMRKTVVKMFWYISAVIMAHMMEVTFSLQFVHLAQITGGFVCMVEIKSVFENITKITNEPVFMKIYKLFEKKAKEAIDTSSSVASTSLSDRETESSVASTSLSDRVTESSVASTSLSDRETESSVASTSLSDRVTESSVASTSLSDRESKEKSVNNNNYGKNESSL